MQYGERATGPPLDRMSPRSYRDSRRRVVDRNSAEWEQKCLLGKLSSDEEPLSPENIAAIKGTGSLYDDNSFLGSTITNTLGGRCPSPVSTNLFLRSMPHFNSLFNKSFENNELSSETKCPENKFASGDGFPYIKNCSKKTKVNYLRFIAACPTFYKENSCESASHLKFYAHNEAKNPVMINNEDRFGEDDDYMNNFQLCRQAYRQWRLDGKVTK